MSQLVIKIILSSVWNPTPTWLKTWCVKHIKRGQNHTKSGRCTYAKGSRKSVLRAGMWDWLYMSSFTGLLPQQLYAKLQNDVLHWHTSHGTTQTGPLDRICLLCAQISQQCKHRLWLITLFTHVVQEALKYSCISSSLYFPCLHASLLAMPHAAVICLAALWNVSVQCNQGQSRSHLYLKHNAL